jgi:hypothetical protein
VPDVFGTAKERIATFIENLQRLRDGRAVLARIDEQERCWRRRLADITPREVPP